MKTETLDINEQELNFPKYRQAQIGLAGKYMRHR